ncbi:RagB/SusD family nutrient uptake outer membrane protein [Prolixibacteraceae bacterium JC049]|nr:RagB/SusD family nutrient uptake outer membrane protein [Prolixibacteraceae bacterium JC049]
MKIKSIYILMSALFIVTACNHLDFDESTGESKEFFYSYFDKTTSLVNHHYSYLYQDFGVLDGAMLDCATDDAEYVYTNSKIQNFNNGIWSALKPLDTRWNESYSAIRSINDFLASYANADFSRFENNKDYAERLKLMESLPYEARLLRAIYYFDLAKRYGAIPMPLTVLTIDEANSISATPFTEVINFIVSECNATAAKLPEVYTQDVGETGRVTKGVAMALKSRALLYAASKLHNANSDVEKWKQAASAALDLMNSGLYQLEGNINTVVTNKITSASNELIMVRRNQQSNAFERKNFPIGYEGGGTGTCPTQNLVDAFQTINGYDVMLTENGWESNDPEFDAATPFANRDPRLRKSVLVNNDQFKGRQLECFQGGQDGAPTQGASITGYYLRKYIQETVDLTPGIESKEYHHWIVFRYAEILLNYAEAMNEAFGPDYIDGSFTISAREALNMVRTRATMPAISPGLSAEEFTAVLRQERRVELAFEGHRFWDIRRWMIGEQTQKQIYGADIQRTDNAVTYSLKTIENRVWSEKMNLYPVPQQELYINPNLVQNQGW